MHADRSVLPLPLPKPPVCMPNKSSNGSTFDENGNLIDDSIVRGNTCVRIVRLLREAGAKEIHMRISAPPIRHSCVYGIDTPTSSELIAAQHSVQEISKEIDADSLAFISEQGMIEAIGRKDSAPNRGHCLACFNGSYPTSSYDTGEQQ